MIPRLPLSTPALCHYHGLMDTAQTRSRMGTLRTVTGLLATVLLCVCATADAAPAAAWNPVAAAAQRSGVHIAPPNLFRDRRDAIDVRVENRNPFPVELTDLAVRPSASREVYATPTAIVPPRSARQITLSLRPGQRQAHRVVFRLAVARDALDALPDLRRVEALFHARAVLRSEGELRDDSPDGRAWREHVEGELRAVDGQLNALQAQLCAQELQTWSSTPPDLDGALDRHGLFRVRARQQPDLVRCLDADVESTIATAALRARRHNLAEWIAVRHDKASATQEPFRGILARAVRAALTDKIAEARKPWSLPSSRLHQWKVALEHLDKLRLYAPDDSYMHPAHPDQPLRAVERLVREFATNDDYDEADGALSLLREQHARGHFGAENLHALQAFVEYERGLHLFGFRRGIDGAHSRANASFSIAASHYPMRARGWKLLLFLTNLQVELVLGLFLAALLVFFGGRTDAWARMRARVRLMAARRTAPHAQVSVDRAWDAVTRAATLPTTRLNDRFRARMGDAVLRQWSGIDARLTREAGQLIAAARAGARHPRWASPSATLRAALAQPRLDDAALAGACAVWDQDPALDVLAAVVRPDPEKLTAAAGHLDDRDLVRAARLRCAVRMAAAGPGSDAPDAFWRRVHNLCAAAEPGAVDEPVRRAATFAAAAAGSTRQAVRWLQAAPEDCDISRSAALTAARAARLPAPSERAECVEALTDLAQILSEWEDGEALDARLRVTVLERLAAGGDDASHGRAAALLQLAGTRRESAATVALACALDLLTDGDHGFDKEAQQTLGERWSLLQALDAFTRQDLPTAAALLAAADPDAASADPSTSVRLDCARAVAAMAMGRVRASEDALRQAHQRASGMGNERDADAATMVVQTVAAQLAPALLASATLDSTLARQIALGSLAAGDDVAIPHRTLVRALLQHNLDGLAFDVLRRATAGARASDPEVSQLWLRLAQRAIDAGDCRHARACVILSRGEVPDLRATPTTTG